MLCCHGYVGDGESETAFSIDATSVTFGRGALAEAGDHARALGCARVALFTDPLVRGIEAVATVERSLREAGVDVAIYDQVKVEPTDASFLDAARFAAEGRFDGFVSVGGGSVIDTCKAANLYATHPADLLTYVNPPVGAGAPVPGPLRPHIACPTTSGTGSEHTGIAVFDLLSLKAKTGIASRRLKPSLALVDPSCTATLPRNVVAASGFDVLCHALESLTALPYTTRRRAARPALRPMSQGANPWSDAGSLEALRICGEYLVRAVRDASDVEAREQMMYGATLAGIAFGNAGVHVPHGMAYAVAGLVRGYRAEGYPQHEPMVPHGMSVVLNAPSVFRFTASTCPERHLAGARQLGADVGGATPGEAGHVLAEQLVRMMKETGLPNGLAGVGYGEADLDALTRGTLAQARLLGNAPCPVDGPRITELFRGALAYW
jgi:hydroxyacid-oxoacid transhydrogenase